MTRRLKRLKDFELTLDINNPDFIRPPREAQRNWLLNRALGELASDLIELDSLAQRFVPGTEASRIEDRRSRDLADDEIMEEWQCPVMEAMARIATESAGDVLEVGFGRGVASDFIQSAPVRSHTVIECNDFVVERFRAWRKNYPERDIRVVIGLWQDTIESLGSFDAVLFHTYPLNANEQIETISKSSTFAEHFFPAAAAHLKPGGVLTYMSNEIDSLSRAHQRALLREFRAVAMHRQPVVVPPDVKDAWWADSMMIVRAEK